MSASTDLSDRAPQAALQWLDQLKGLGLIAIFWVHGVEQLFPAPAFSNPKVDWMPLADRIAQLQPLTEFGWANLPLTLFRNVGWLGDQGVQLFLITSGFGLTWSLLQRSARQTDAAPSETVAWWQFYQRRLFRLYPLWWAAHLLILLLQLVSHKIPSASLTNPGFYLSLMGIRFTPTWAYALVPSWWFIGLLVQLYLIYPLLWRGFQRLGPTKLLLWVGAIALAIRGAGLFIVGDYLDCWSRGTIFIARLPEFLLGMSFAGWLHQHPRQTDRLLRSGQVQVLGWVIYGLGLITAFTLGGMTVSPFLLGVGLLILLYGLLQSAAKPWLDRLPLVWIGQHSYALFLVQHIFIKALVPDGQALLRGLLGLIIAAGCTIVTAIGLEKTTEWVSQRLRPAPTV
jgi:peptidoglycan/LPS O-acetylase OafA/YrhL